MVDLFASDLNISDIKGQNISLLTRVLDADVPRLDTLDENDCNGI